MRIVVEPGRGVSCPWNVQRFMRPQALGAPRELVSVYVCTRNIDRARMETLDSFNGRYEAHLVAHRKDRDERAQARREGRRY